jgi:hypothetical protein
MIQNNITAFVLGLALLLCSCVSDQQGRTRFDTDFALTEVTTMQQDIQDLSLVLDPVTEAAAIEKLQAVVTALSKTQASLEQFKMSNGDSTADLWQSVDLLLDTSTKLSEAFTDPNDEKARQVRLVLVVVRAVVRRVRLYTEPPGEPEGIEDNPPEPAISSTVGPVQGEN